MKPITRLLCTSTLALLATAASAATNVGVSVEVSQPGVYGRVDIGRFPQPQVIVPQPVVIARPVVVQPVQPVYMWVPPGHRKDWGKHCRHYNACGVPVYFVRHDWYNSHVMAADSRGHDQSGKGHDHPGKGHGKPGKGHGKGKGHD